MLPILFDVPTALIGISRGSRRFFGSFGGPIAKDWRGMSTELPNQRRHSSGEFLNFLSRHGRRKGPDLRTSWRVNGVWNFDTLKWDWLKIRRRRWNLPERLGRVRRPCLRGRFRQTSHPSRSRLLWLEFWPIGPRRSHRNSWECQNLPQWIRFYDKGEDSADR